MADTPEMVVVDPDAPTDQSAKRAIMSVPTWEEWLQAHGFVHRIPGAREGGAQWRRVWLDQGRGWHVRVYPADDTIHICVYNNPLRNNFRQLAVANVSERSLPRVVQQLITEIEREVSDATKKRRIKAYTKTLNYEDRKAIAEAGPLRRPIPDDPSELNKPQMDQMLDRIQTRCFQKGQRVRVRTQRHTRLDGELGTVVDAGANSAYVNLDLYDGDDPFRFGAEELETIHESEDLDAPEPYIAALDYIVPLKHAGYRPHPGLVGARAFYKHITGATGELELKVTIYPDTPTKAVISADYRQAGEGDHMIDSVLDAIDVADRARELETLFLNSTSAVDFSRKIKAKNYPNSSLPSRENHLIYLFGESALEPDDPDNPQPYFQELQRHGEVLTAFRSMGVRMRRRMATERPYYSLFYIPSAVTDVSYDIYLEPKGDQSWEVTAEGSKEFQDQVGVDWQEEFDIEQSWTIPAGVVGDVLNDAVYAILAALRKHVGPDEPTINGPEVDDIDEGIDDPVEMGALTQDREALLKQEGYVYKADYKGNPHWEKKWPLPLPIKTGKATLTHLMLAPGHGQIWYSLVDAAGRPKGGYSIKLPGGDTPYLTSLRRGLLKMRHVAERMPVDANFNDMFAFLRVAFDKVEDEVDSESRVTESEDDLDFEKYAKDSVGYNPVQLLQPRALRRIAREAGYTVYSLYHSRRTTGFSLRLTPADAETFQKFRSNPGGEAERIRELYRTEIMKLLPNLGKIERGMYNVDDKLTIHCWDWSGEGSADPNNSRNYTLHLDIQPSDAEQRRNNPRTRRIKENEDPDRIEDLSAYLKSTPDAVAAIKEAGYQYTPDANGRRRWWKVWPLPQPVQRGPQLWQLKWTHLWASPDPWGQFVYALVDEAKAFHHSSDGGYIIVKPVKRASMKEDADYTTSVRRMLLKVEALVKDIPAGTDAQALRDYIFNGMVNIQNEVNAESVPTWDEDEQALDLHTPLPPVAESLDDPDADVNAAAYADDTLNVAKTLETLGYRYDGLAHFPHWAKYINPNLLFLIFYEGGTNWHFQVYRPLDASGRWALKTSSPGREISTLRPDLEKWEWEARTGTLLSGVNESVDDVDASAYARSTYDPVEFLKANGWAYHSTASRDYYAKTFPMPKPYRLGGMTFTGVQVRIGVDANMFGSTWVSVYFVDNTGNGFGVEGYELSNQQVFGWDEDNGEIPRKHLDNSMPIRRFATGVEEVLNNVAWPEASYAAQVASNHVKQALDRFCRTLNKLAAEPLHPEIRENIDDPVDPQAMLNQVPEQVHVVFTRLRSEDEEIAQANFPGVPLEQALRQQFERELNDVERNRLRNYKILDFQVGPEDDYMARVAFTGYSSDTDLYWDLVEAFRTGMAGEFKIEQYRGASGYKSGEGGGVVESEDPADDPAMMLRSQPSFEFRDTSYIGVMVFVKGPGEDKSDWPKDIGRILFGPAPDLAQHKVWYVLGVRGVNTVSELEDYGFGIRKNDKLRTFNSPDEAAMALWLVWSRLPEKKKRGYDLNIG